MMIDQSNLRTPFFISAVTAVLAIGALLTGGYALVTTLLSSFGAEVDPEQQVATWIERHEERMDTYTTRFNGRSVFYTPTPTPRPTPPPPPITAQPERTAPPAPVDTGPPPPPASYSGPQLLAILGEEIWIRGSSGANAIVRVKVGQEREGVRLITTSPPWTAELGWSRGEYTVPLFESAVPGISEVAPANLTASVPGIINEGDIDPATLTSGISINASPFTPAGAGGRNIARPANSAAIENRPGVSSRRNRGGGRSENSEDAKTRMLEEQRRAEADQKQREYEEWQRERQRDDRERRDD